MRIAVVLAGAVFGVFASVPAYAAPAAGATASTPNNLPLNIRATASATGARLGTLGNGARVAADCHVLGQWIEGSLRTTNRWDRIVTGGYVSDSYVARAAELPHCSTLTPPAPPAAGPGPAAAGTFLGRTVGPARASRVTHGVPVSVTLAQAILESGWGTSALTRVDRNYFGIKCFGWSGPIAVKCAPYPTSECAKGRCYRTTAPFRSYRSLEDSFLDHGRFLRVNDRYDPAFAFLNDPNGFARAIARAGYATDPGYADKLIALMGKYNLYQFD